MSLEAAQLLEQADAAIAGGTFDDMLGEASDEVTTDDEQATDAKPEQAAATPEPKAEAPKADAEYPEGTPIASKSGEFTIPYEKLTDARTRATESARERDQALQERDALRAELAAIKQQQGSQGQQTHADNVQQATDALEAGADPALFGDWSEEGIAKGVAELNRRAVAQAEARMEAKLEQALAPLKAQRMQTAADAHYAPILAKHPDADEFTESKEFADWQANLPAHVKRGVEQVMAEGTPAEIIGVFDSFKADTGRTTAAQPAQKVTLPEAKDHVPASLSEMAGAAPVDEVERVLKLTGAALMDAMERMTPEQRERVLDRI